MRPPSPRLILEMAEQSRFLLAKRPLELDEAAKSLLNNDVKQRLGRLRDRLAKQEAWDSASLADALKSFAADEGVGMGQIGPGLRATLTGGKSAPDLGQTLELLGREETLARLADQT